MGFIIASIISCEGLVYCVIALIAVQWGKKLDNHLEQNHFQFWKDNLDLPFWRGGPAVMRRRNHAIKVTYFGIMPDELSRIYQKKLRFFVALDICVLLFMFLTMGGIVLIGWLFKL